MRLFFGIRIPGPEYLEGLFGELNGLGKGLKTVRPENMHITLKFLGDPGVPEDDVADAVKGISEDTPPIKLSVSGSGAFPNWKRPSVLWIGFNGTGLEGLASNLDRRLNERIGFPLERREFRPHLTVARAKGKFDIKMARKKMDSFVISYSSDHHEFPIGGFELISSDLGPDGPSYRTVATFPLEG